MWCAEHASVLRWPEDADISHPTNTRAGAMSLAEHWFTVTVTLPPDLTHPENIRQWAREQKQTALLPADLSDIPAESIESIELDERSAERIAKVIHRLPAGAGYMKGTPSPWSPRGKTSFIQGVEAQSHYTPGTGELATVTPRGDPSKVCGEKFSRITS